MLAINPIRQVNAVVEAKVIDRNVIPSFCVIGLKNGTVIGTKRSVAMKLNEPCATI